MIVLWIILAPVPAGYGWQLPGISHRLRPGA